MLREVGGIGDGCQRNREISIVEKGHRLRAIGADRSEDGVGKCERLGSGDVYLYDLVIACVGYVEIAIEVDSESAGGIEAVGDDDLTAICSSIPRNHDDTIVSGVENKEVSITVGGNGGGEVNFGIGYCDLPGISVVDQRNFLHGIHVRHREVHITAGIHSNTQGALDRTAR